MAGKKRSTRVPLAERVIHRLKGGFRTGMRKVASEPER